MRRGAQLSILGAEHDILGSVLCLGRSTIHSLNLLIALLNFRNCDPRALYPEW
jgi:hypothetical protein